MCLSKCVTYKHSIIIVTHPPTHPRMHTHIGYTRTQSTSLGLKFFFLYQCTVCCRQCRIEVYTNFHSVCVGEREEELNGWFRVYFISHYFQNIPHKDYGQNSLQVASNRFDKQLTLNLCFPLTHTHTHSHWVHWLKRIEADRCRNGGWPCTTCIT